MVSPSSTEVDGIVSCIRFGPSYHCTSLLAIGTANRLSVKQCTLNVNHNYIIIYI